MNKWIEVPYVLINSEIDEINVLSPRGRAKINVDDIVAVIEADISNDGEGEEQHVTLLFTKWYTLVIDMSYDNFLNMYFNVDENI